MNKKKGYNFDRQYITVCMHMSHLYESETIDKFLSIYSLNGVGSGGLMCVYGVYLKDFVFYLEVGEVYDTISYYVHQNDKNIHGTDQRVWVIVEYRQSLKN